MAQLTRRQAIVLAVAGTTMTAMATSLAGAAEFDDRCVKLFDSMEGFRKEIPPAEGMEGEGQTNKQIFPYTFQHLEGVARRLKVTTKAECLILLTYMKEPDVKIRCIAIKAIESVIHAYPNGYSVECTSNTQSEGHRKMVLRFVRLIGKLPN